MVTREVLRSHVSQMAGALRTGQTVKLPIGDRGASVDVYDPSLVHPFQSESPQRALWSCNSTLGLLERLSGSTSTELHASIDKKKSLGAVCFGVLAGAGVLGGIAGFVHGYLNESLVQMLGEAIAGFAVGAFAGERAGEYEHLHEFARESDHARLRAWENAIETGAPDRMPLFEVSDTGNDTWNAWARMDAEPVVAKYVAQLKPQGLPELAAGLQQSSPIQDLPDALVMAGTRLRKRA